MKEFLFLECGKPTEDFISSEYLFWRDVIGFKGSIVCCGGNRGIKKELIRYGGNITAGDKVYVFLDVINVMYGDTTIDKLAMDIIKICSTLKCTVYFNIDFSFESMILRSEIFWKAWINKLCCGKNFSQHLSTYIAQLHVCLVKSFKKNIESRDDLIPTLNYLWGNMLGSNTTPEQVIATLVKDMSCKSGYVVDKGSLGYCWLYDCGYITPNVSGYYADKPTGCNQNSVGVLSLLCHKKLCDDINNLIVDGINDTKRKIILNDLCSGDYHNLFELV